MYSSNLMYIFSLVLPKMTYLIKKVNITDTLSLAGNWTKAFFT